MLGLLAVAFVSGSFVASPELRVYAANTVGSADIINNSILSADIKDGEVKTVDLGGNAVTSAKVKDGEIKAAEIATDAVGADEIAKDAVGASEIKGVDKLLFADCAVPGGTMAPGGVLGFFCTVAGVDSEDNAIATLTPTINSSFCLVVINNNPVEGNVIIDLRNVCTTNATIPPGATVSIIVYDELPDKVLP